MNMMSHRVLCSILFFSFSRAQVSQIPVGGLAVLPEGFSREEDQPFTSTYIPEGSSNSKGAQIIEDSKNVSFVAFAPAFNAIVGSNPKLEETATKDYAFALNTI